MDTLSNPSACILIVDDNPDVRTSLAKEMQHHGFACETAINGVEGVQRLISSEPEVVLLDLEMPGLDGFGVLAAMQKNGIKSIPIVLSGAISVARTVEAMKLGAFDCLEKPCDSDLLEQTILQALEHRRTLELADRMSALVTQWQAVFNASPDMIVVLNSDGMILRCNLAVACQTGMDQNELIGKDVHETLCHLEHERKDCPYLLKPNQSEKEVREYRILGKYYDFCVSSLSDETQVSWGWMVTARDITERKRTELELQESEKRFLDVLYASDDAILLLDQDRFVDCNEATLRLLEYNNRNDILMRHPADLSPALQPDGRTSKEKAQELIQNGSHHFEWVHLKASGEEFLAEVTLTPISYKGRNMMHCLWRDLTQKKQIEEALQNSNERLRAIMDSVRTGILVLEGNTYRILDANPNAVRMIGLPKSAIIGLDSRDIIYSATLEDMTMADKMLFTDSTETEAVLIAANERWIPILKTSVGTKIGGRNCLIESFLDISDLKKAEQELHASIEQQSAIFESSMVGILVMRGRIIAKANRRMAAMLGYSQEEMEGRNAKFIHLSHENYLTFDEQYYSHLTQEHATVQMEYPLLHKDGHTVWCLFSGKAIAPPDLEYGVVWAIEDITKRKQDEEILRENEEKYHQIVEYIQVGVALISPKMQVLELNRQMRTWYPGIQVEEHPLCEVAFGCPPDDAASIYYPTVQTLQDRNFHETVSEIFMGGSTHLFRLATSPIHNAGGEIVAVIEMVQDVTEQRMMEMQLRQSQKLESIGAMAAGIAHEINTPMQFIGDNTHFIQEAFADILALLEEYNLLRVSLKKGNVEPALITELDEIIERIDFDFLRQEIPTAIERSIAGIDRVTKIVRAVKEFSHPSGSERAVVDINKAIESTITVARNEWKYVANLKTNYDPALPMVPCFPGPFNQVILNLIINSAHAIAEKIGEKSAVKGDIMISTKQLEQQVEIKIQDTGAGIPKDIRERIYDPFFTTKSVGKGTGQGLAITHAVIVEQHKGTIQVESTEGVGTTFTIRLPLFPPEN
ncbi:TPA: hypothetical protein DDW35_07455 [Candidatus Sumerlaeota bacterium]|nr:hypothetical protein [Candidatus Sumerlaeota bacterium]